MARCVISDRSGLVMPMQPQHRLRTWDPQVRRLRQYQRSSRGMRKGLDTCPPLPQQQAEWRSSRSAERPAGVDTCPIPALGWRAGLPHVLRHVRGQPCLRDTWPESFRGQGRFPAASSPVAAATAVYLFFRRMAAGVHGNNALDPSPIKRVHLHLPSTTATASLLTWLAGLCRGCGFFHMRLG